MPRAISPELLDCLRRPNPYTEIRAEITAPDVGMVLRRPDLYGPAGTRLVAGSVTPANSIATDAQGALVIAPSSLVLAQRTGVGSYFDLNFEDPERRKKGLSFELDPAFAHATVRTFTAQVQRIAQALGVFRQTRFELQVYRVTRVPGSLVAAALIPANAPPGAVPVYTSKLFTQYTFAPLLSTAAVIQAKDVVWGNNQLSANATLTFDVSQQNLVLENTPGQSSAADQAGEVPKYYFVITTPDISAGSTGWFRWLCDNAASPTTPGIGTFKRSFWARNVAADPWVENIYPDTPAFTLEIDSYGASAQADYALDMGRLPVAGATGRVVFDRSIPPGTSATMELSTDDGASYVPVKDGDVVALAQQGYRARVALASDTARRVTPGVTGIGVEFRTPTDVSVESVVQWPTREIAPPWLTPSIPEGRISVLRLGRRDFLDVATRLGSTQPAPRLEVDLFLASRHPSVTRDKWLRLERFTVSDRVPTSLDEQFTCLSFASKLKKKVPQKKESLSTVHRVTSSTASAVQVSPALIGTVAGGNDYVGKNYYMRVASTVVAGIGANFEQAIAGSSGTAQLDFSPALPFALAVGDLIEVHSGVFETAPVSYVDQDPADVWWDILTNLLGISAERVGSGKLARGGLPPNVTDRAPGDVATQAKLKVSFKIKDESQGDELLDQLAFIMGGATIELNGQIVFIQIYPLRAPDGTVTVPLPASIATLDKRDYTSFALPPALEQRATVVTCDYGINAFAASPGPGSTTVVADNDAQAWLSVQDLDEHGSSAVPDGVKRWLYNSPASGGDRGLYLASQCAGQVVRAASMGLMLATLDPVESRPDLIPGDVVTVITDEFTAYDPTKQSAISGWVALQGVVVRNTTLGTQLTIYVLGLSDNVANIAGGLEGNLNGVGAPDLPPDTTGPSLDVAAAVDPADPTEYIVRWSGDAALLSTDGGVTYAAPPVSPIHVARNPSGGVGKVYSFRGFRNGQTATDTVTIPAIGKDTVSPDLSVVPGSMTDTFEAFVVNATNPAGGAVPVITVTTHNTTVDVGAQTAIASDTPTVAASGTAIIVSRPAYASPPSSVTVRSEIAGGGAETITRTILNRDKTKFGPNLVVTYTEHPTTYDISATGDHVHAFIDGVDQGELFTPAFNVDREAPGGVAHSYKFTGNDSGQTVSETVIVPPQERTNLDQIANTAGRVAVTPTQAAGAGKAAAAIDDTGTLNTDALDFARSYRNKNLGNIGDGGGRYAAAEANANNTESRTAGNTANVGGISSAYAQDGSLRALNGLTLSGRLQSQFRSTPLNAMNRRSVQTYTQSASEIAGADLLYSNGLAITINAHDVLAGSGSDGSGLPIHYNGGSCYGAAYGTNYVFATDSEFAGGTTTFYAIQYRAYLASFDNRYYVGQVDCINGGGYGGGTPGACCDPETLIRMADGTVKRAIEIVRGDVVYTCGENSLFYGAYAVVAAEVVDVAERWLLTMIDGRKRAYSTNHRFRVGRALGQWTAVQDLTRGMWIEGTRPGVVRDVVLGKPGTVVKLSIMTAATYIGDGLLSHNMKAV